MIVFSGSIRRVFFLKLGEGARLPKAVAEALEERGVGFAYIHAIGGFSEAKLAVFNIATKTYHYSVVKPLENHVLEVVSLIGNSVRGPDGKHYPHIHVLVARRPGELYAGHLVEATVKPFLEVIVLELPGELKAAEALSHRWRERFSFREET